MLGGDLSNRTAPRVLIVFEGLLGYLPADKVTEYEEYVDKEQWDSVVYQFKFNDAVINRILYLTWNKDFNFHVVTWFPPAAAEAIQEKLEQLSVPVRSVFSSTPSKLAKILINQPDITCVYDVVHQHVLTFGSKAKLVTDISDIGA